MMKRFLSFAAVALLIAVGAISPSVMRPARCRSRPRRSFCMPIKPLPFPTVNLPALDAEHIRAARAVGIRSHRFISAARLRRDLEAAAENPGNGRLITRIAA